jgi:small subunit ribosomal protein S27e
METKSRFVRVHCKKCKNEQNIYSCASSKVYCLVCNELLAEPTGGRSKIHAQVLEIIN